MRKPGKQLKAYGDHLLETFRDGFPNGTAYQKAETEGLAVTFLGGSEAHEVFLTIPCWTSKGHAQKTFLHSLVVKKKAGFKRGTILRPTTKRVIGTTKHFDGIAWNRR